MARKIPRKKLVRTEVLSIRFTRAELEQIAEAALRDDETLAVWARTILVKASDPETGFRATKADVTLTPLASAHA